MGKIWLSPSNGCWVDLWPEPQFRGRRLRLTGPVDLPYLRIGDADPSVADGFHDAIGSLVVGPGAYLQCYEDLNFHDSVSWLLPDQRVADVAELTCNDDIDSVRLFDRPPFAHEPGYAAYILWAVSSKSWPPDLAVLAASRRAQRPGQPTN